MIKLYGKIFIGFWITCIAVMLTWVIAGHYLDSMPHIDDSRSHELRQWRAPNRLIHSLHYNLQALPADQLPAWLAEQKQTHNIKILLVDDAGNDIYQRKLSKNARKVLKILDRGKRRARVIDDRKAFLGNRLLRPDLGISSSIFIVPRPNSQVVELMMRHFWLRVLIGIIISGLICYALSRYMTRPISTLRSATERLANGDLDTRIEVPEHGGDETAELGRDFNRMADQIREQIKSRERLLHDVSHELRSPLARLRLASALAQESDDSKKYLQRIDHDVDRLDSLISQLLIPPDETFYGEDSIDLNALLKELIFDAGFEAEAEGKSVIFECNLKEAVVNTSGDLLHKAFDNIIRNAVSYTAANTTVTVSLREITHGFQIDVRDHGPGVPENDLKKLFDSFYRVDTARDRSTGGYGLGLSIARRAITQHGGSIHAENTSSGLVIIATLPSR